MSAMQLYQNTKIDKKEVSEKVLYNGTQTKWESEIESLKKAIDMLNKETQRINEIVKHLESLRMPEFTEKHARMKENFNGLVGSVNAYQVETNSIVLDVGNRLNEIEARLSIKQ